MSGLILPGRFNAQPQYPAKVAKNSLTRGLVKLFTPASGGATPIGGITPIIGADGVGFRATSSAAYYRAGASRIISGSPQWTVVTGFSTTQSINGSGSSLYCERGPSGGNILKLEGLGNGVPYLQMTVRDDAFNLAQFQGSKTITNDGKFHIAAGVGYAANDRRLFIDGRQEASNSSNIPSTFTEVGVESRIGSDANDTSSFITGPIYFVALYNRALDPGEIAAIWERRWNAFFKAPSRKLWPVTASGEVTGTVAYTNADDTSAASGTTTVIGSVSATNANDTVSASGSPVIVGSLAVSNADDSVSASGAVGSAVSGSVSYTNADDSVAASGTTTVTGSIAYTNASDTVAASGTTSVIGSLAVTNADDTVSASGTVEEIEVIGTVSVTNADDTVAASGTTTILGSLSYSNKNDTTSASGLVNNGTLVESTLTTGIAQSIRIKKPGIPVNTPEWLRTILEIIVGRRNNKITVPAFQELTFSATPTKAECEALYSYVNDVRNSLESLINRFDS